MTLYRWSEMIIVIIGLGSLFTAIVCLGSLAALKLRLAWYRWRVARDAKRFAANMTRGDITAARRQILDVIARYTR